MNGACVAVVGAAAGVWLEAVVTSPTLGGGGTGDVDCRALVGAGMAPGCGGGGEVVDVVGAKVVVGARVFKPAGPVGAGRLGAAPGRAVA